MLIDAAHCPGAVMFLFKSQRFGNVLHTGDFRLAEPMLQNEFLFPPEKRNKEGRAMSIDIDYLHLDNTFADPKFDTPSREEAYAQLKGIVESHKDFRIFLFCYYLGKEEVFINLAEDFETLVSE